MKVHRNASLKNFNTFNVDEKARILFEINNISDLSNILSKEAQKDEILVLGGGSNVLLTKDFEGLVLKNEVEGIEIIENISISLNLLPIQLLQLTVHQRTFIK